MNIILVTVVITLIKCTLSVMSGKLCLSRAKEIYISCPNIIMFILKGIPILRLNACSESEATLTCVVTELTILYWNIDFLNGDDINRVSFYLSNTIGSQLRLNRITGVGGIPL